MANIIERLFDSITSALPEFDVREVPQPDYPQNEESQFPFDSPNDVVHTIDDELDLESVQRRLLSDGWTSSLTDDERRLLDGGVRHRGLEAFAYYKSRRFLDQRPYPKKWGIFYLHHGIDWVAFQINRSYPAYRSPVVLAREFLRRHERFHFQFDIQTLQLESVLRMPLYEPLRVAYARCPQYLSEEGLANKYAWKWASKSEVGIREFAEDFFDLQPAAYARYRESERVLASELAANLVDRNYSPGARRDDLAPWVGLLPPDLLRASLCPEYVVRPSSLGSWVRPQLVFPPVVEVVETSGFSKLLSNKYQSYNLKWSTTRNKLLTAPDLIGLNFKPWADGSWSVRVDDNFRAHLRHEGNGRWLAEKIGPHTVMGHG